MIAGRRDTLVTLEGFTAAQDEYGQETQAWAELGQEWAAVFYGAGSERRQAAAEQGEQAASFEMLMNERTRALTVKDRIVADGAAWDIKGIAPDTPRRGSIAVTATRAT